MSTLSIRLTESLHKHAKECAVREGISVNQLVSTALAEKLSALTTHDDLAERARRGQRGKFELALAKVPDAEPQAGDRR